MNKKLLAIQILMPVVVAAIVVLLVLQIKFGELHPDNDVGIAYVFIFLLSIIPMFAMAILGAAGIVISILLFTVKNKLKAVTAALVIVCLLVPFALFNAFVVVSSLLSYIEVPVAAIAVVAADIAALVLCSIYIHEERKKKKEPQPYIIMY